MAFAVRDFHLRLKNGRQGEDTWTVNHPLFAILAWTTLITCPPIFA
jgi:hypothetical protein